MAEGDGKAGIPIGPAEWAAGTRNADRPRPFCRTGEWGVGRMHPVTTLAEHFRRVDQAVGEHLRFNNDDRRKGIDMIIEDSPLESAA